MTFAFARDSRGALGVALVLGLLARLAIFWHTTALPTQIVDEQHYAQLARSLVRGEGFAFGPDYPTSIRPPLYPGVVAALWTVTGPDNLQAVRFAQILLALLTTGVVHALAKRVFGLVVARYAAAAFWLYPSFAFFNFLVLTETLFTLLLMAFLLAAVKLVQDPTPAVALACGLALGLAVLTRSVLWPLPLVLCPLLALLIRESWRTRLALAAIVLAGYAIVVTPWAIRNTRLQGVTTIVDTMGGINLRMGNYEFTPDDRMWDAVALTGEQNWSYALSRERPGERFTEGQKEKWAQKKALAYMRDHPATTLRRSLIKFADFWGLEREFIAGVQQGVFSPPPWFAWLGTTLIVGAYAVMALLGAAGIWLAAPEWRAHLLLLLPVLAITAAHTIVFGHSRYHLPIVPVLLLYGTALVVRRHEIARRRRPLLLGAAGLTMALLVAIWLRQIILVDAGRLRALFADVG